MTKLNAIYKCSVCGNMVEMVHTGVGQLVCCDKSMNLIEEKTTDPEISVEKHVPVIEKNEKGAKIKIGSIPHPMEDAHYIEWIEVITIDGEVKRKYLKPGEKPEAEFCLFSQIKYAREYCNLHGLWRAEDLKPEAPKLESMPIAPNKNENPKDMFE